MALTLAPIPPLHPDPFLLENMLGVEAYSRRYLLDGQETLRSEDEYIDALREPGMVEAQGYFMLEDGRCSYKAEFWSKLQRGEAQIVIYVGEALVHFDEGQIRLRLAHEPDDSNGAFVAMWASGSASDAVKVGVFYDPEERGWSRLTLRKLHRTLHSLAQSGASPEVLFEEASKEMHERGAELVCKDLSSLTCPDFEAIVSVARRLLD